MRAAAASLTAAASVGGDPAILHAVLAKTASTSRASYNLLLSRYPPSHSEPLLSRLPVHPNAASLNSYLTSAPSSSPSSAASSACHRPSSPTARSPPSSAPCRPPSRPKSTPSPSSSSSPRPPSPRPVSSLSTPAPAPQWPPATCSTKSPLQTGTLPATPPQFSNIYSAVGKMDEMAKTWTVMRDRGIRKEGGRSWIEVRGQVHVFVANERRHDQLPEIYSKLIRGTVPAGNALRILKNLRICV